MLEDEPDKVPDSLALLEQLRDMRKWSNNATTPDWEFHPTP